MKEKNTGDRSVRGMTVIMISMALPFLFLLIYTGMTVEVSSLKRKIRVASMKRDELSRKNDALKKVVAEMSGNNLDRLYWKQYGVLPFYVKNQVINLRLEDGGKEGDYAED